VYYSWKLH